MNFEALGRIACFMMASGVIISVIALYVLIEIEKYKEEQRDETREFHAER